MRKSDSARAVIIEGDEVYLIFRIYKNQDGSYREFYVCPGGGVEDDETLEETVTRELKEELSVDIKIIKYLGKEESEKGVSNYFKCEIINGTPTLGGEELEKNNPDNYYEIRKMKIDDLKDKTVYVYDFILKAYEEN